MLLSSIFLKIDCQLLLFQCNIHLINSIDTSKKMLSGKMRTFVHVAFVLW